MEDAIWYVYHDGQQLGPFPAAQVRDLHHKKMIAQSAFVFKVGWPDWRPLQDTAAELGIEGITTAADGAEGESKRLGAPRVGIQGRVVIHNNGHLAIGTGVNISISGIFIETRDALFAVGERLKLSVRCEGIDKPFNAVAKVIRFNNDSRYATGYGLQFEEIDPAIVARIRSLIDDYNQQRRQRAQGTA